MKFLKNIQMERVVKTLAVCRRGAQAIFVQATQGS